MSMFNHTLAFSTQTKSLHDDIASCGFQSTVSVHLQHQKKLRTSCLRSADDQHSFRDVRQQQRAIEIETSKQRLNFI